MEWVKRQDLEAVGDSRGSREAHQGLLLDRGLMGRPFPTAPQPVGAEVEQEKRAQHVRVLAQGPTVRDSGEAGSEARPDWLRSVRLTVCPPAPNPRSVSPK